MSTVSFTLPVSCQVCLGKVKQPVVCPNLHVFCAPCMNMWLQRSPHCPTCRVPISAGNPCRQVLGGLNPQADKGDDFSNKELRRCRMELIYKEYEAEVERLEQELNVTTFENKELKSKLQGVEVKDTPKGTPTKQDMSMITSINNKLKDATKLYENIKTDMKTVKKENKAVKEEAENLRRENQSLRLELNHRSPRKFGRYTVATLENKIETCEKEIKQLQKALERSDQYIAEIESDLNSYKDHKCPKCHSKTASSGKGDAHFDDSQFDDSELPSRISRASDDLSDTDEGQVKKSAKYDESFGLEMPSPMTPGTVGSSLTVADPEKDSFMLLQPSPYKEKTVDDAKKKLRFSVPNDSSDEYLTKSGTSGLNHNPGSSMNQLSFHHSTVGGMVSGNVGSQGFLQQGPSHLNSIPHASAGKSSNFNISITPEMEDCLRLMDQAEKRCKDNSPPQQTRSAVSASVFPRHGSFGQDNPSSFSRGLITSEVKPNVPAVPGFPGQFAFGSSFPPAGPVVTSTFGIAAASSGSMLVNAPTLSGVAGSHGGMEAFTGNLQSLSQRSHITQSTEQLKSISGRPLHP